MLQVMRDLAKSWIFKGLMMFLMISFAIWGIGDIFRGNPMQRTVGKAGKLAISVQALEQKFQSDMSEARRILGPDLTVQQARQMGLLDRTLNNMLEQAMFDQEIKRLGLSVGDETILERVASIPQLRDKDGKFNTLLFRRLLAKNGLTEKSFLENEKKEAARHILFESLLYGTKAPQLLIDNLYKAEGQRRVLEMVTLKNDSITDIAKPDEAALKSFYEANPTQFTAPEYRTLTVIRLSGDAFTKDITVTDEEVKQAYDERDESLKKPETRDFEQVIAQDEAKAQKVADAAKEGKDLAAAAKANGLKATSLEAIEASSLPETLKNAFFALKEGEISAPVKSDLGWHIVQVKKIAPEGKPSFASVEKDLKATLEKEKIADEVARQVNSLDDALAANRSLEDIADGMNLRLYKFPSIDAKGTPDEGKLADEIPFKDEVLKQAFEQNGGDTSQILDDKKGNYYVVRTDEVTPSQVTPFEKIQAKVTKAWTEAEKEKKAAEEAGKIADALREGKKATSFASRNGIEVRLSKPLSALGLWDKDLPQSFAQAVFSMKKDDVIALPNGDKQYILRLADIVEADPKQEDETKLKLTDSLNKEVPYEILEQYSSFLRLRFPITIDRDLLESLKKQGS